MAAIDHLVQFVPDLDAGIDAVERRDGVRPTFGGRHEGRGTHNALVSLGDCYLELIAPDPSRPDPPGPRPFGIDGRHEPAFVAYAVRPAPGETLDDVLDALRSAGVDPGEASAMSRTTPDGDELRWRLTFPSTDRPGIPFVIDWGDTPQPHTTAPSGPELRSLRIVTPEATLVRSVVTALGLDGRIEVEPGPDAIVPVF